MIALLDIWPSLIINFLFFQLAHLWSYYYWHPLFPVHELYPMPFAAILCICVVIPCFKALGPIFIGWLMSFLWLGSLIYPCLCLWFLHNFDVLGWVVIQANAYPSSYCFGVCAFADIASRTPFLCQPSWFLQVYVEFFYPYLHSCLIGWFLPFLIFTKQVLIFTTFLLSIEGTLIIMIKSSNIFACIITAKLLIFIQTTIFMIVVVVKFD